MPLPITEDHRALSETAADFLASRKARDASRALLEAEHEPLPDLWDELCALGWAGLHLPEEHGGSGFGLPELVIVVEALGRAVAPGPFVPTVVASAVIAAAAPEELKAELLPGLADGSVVGAVSLGGSVDLRDGEAHGPAGIVLSGALADVVLVPVGDDVAVVRCAGAADNGTVSVVTPHNLDPTRRCSRLSFSGAPAERLPGARRLLVDVARLVFSAEAVGVAGEATDMAAEYAKVRQQFGRPIATFQAVKHHCANMLVGTELATAAVWDAARAAAAGGDQLTYAAAVAAAVAIPAVDQATQLNIQVHGGIGFTWEHDAHLYMRRATVLGALADADAAATEVTDLVRRGVRRHRSVDLPPEAELIRESVRRFVDQVKGRPADQVRQAMIDEGYAVPHWPKPWGRDAGAVEQLVIEQEFEAAAISQPVLGITGWVILTLVQHATEEQVARWVLPALRQEVVWCQLFSEPDAGSDAAGIKTRGTRVDGGWVVNGQKVWTSGAQLSSYGLATVRTNPDAPKHAGITTMVIDLHAEGVEVRPLRMLTGGSEFNEVFFNDVFVPDDDVVGPVDGGWTVARATLGNESVSIGGGQGGGRTLPLDGLIAPFDAHPERLPGGASRVGHHIAISQAMDQLNLRSAHRAVAGGGPGPEGNITKLVLSEQGHEARAIMAALTGADTVFTDGTGRITAFLVLWNRAMSIAGGTSEIKRNQIAERILGLPRDPLIV